MEDTGLFIKLVGNRRRQAFADEPMNWLLIDSLEKLAEAEDAEFYFEVRDRELDAWQRTANDN